jgi:hypothetical protein
MTGKTKLHMPDEIRNTAGVVLARFTDIRANKLSDNEVMALRERVQKEKNLIHSQIEEAELKLKADPGSVDRAWLLKAKGVVRLKGAQLLRLGQELGRMNRYEKKSVTLALSSERQANAARKAERAAAFERMFVSKAFEILPKELYSQIMDATHAAMKQEQSKEPPDPGDKA